MTQTHHLSGRRRIIVAGCGIAGSTFVSALDQLWPVGSPAPEILVYEKHSREDCIQHESSVLTLHGTSEDEGMIVLQKLRRLENIKAEAELTSAYFNVWDENWKFLSDIHPQRYRDLPASAMRIQRDHLLHHLVDKAERVPGAKIHWGCACVSAKRLESGLTRVNVQDAGGVTTTSDCDVLVIADGAEGTLSSQLRTSEAKMEYLGVNIVSGIAHFPSDLPLPLGVLDSGGMQLSDGQGTCCMYLPLDPHNVRWVLSKTGSDKAPSNSDIRKKALAMGSMFKDPFQTVVEATDATSAFAAPAKQRTPFTHEKSPPGTVFIGDANHVFSIFNNKGADMALKDGWDLAEQFCRNTSIADAVKAYDGLSIPRVQGINDFARHRIDFGHSTGVKWGVFKVGMQAQRALGKVGHKYR